MNETYVLHHEGTWFYYLAATSPGTGVYADGEPMTGLGGGHRAGWWACAHQARVIELRRRQPPRVTGYRLRDHAAASDRYPAALDVAGYRERCRSSDADAEVLAALYEPATEERDPEVTTVTAPSVRLDGQPPPADGRTWVAQLPFALANRREYLHLFAGYMPGFRDHMATVLKKLPHVEYVLDAKHAAGAAYGLEVTLQVPFDKPATEYKPARNLDGSVSRSRKGRTVPVLATRRLEFTVPYRIDASNRAAAAAEWDRREAELAAAVTSASVAACSACHGYGYVPVGGDRR